MHSRTRLVRILLAGVALLVAALACNLEIGADDDGSDAALVPTVERPTVEILEPAQGATFTTEQVISVRARATSASGVTLVELLVNGVTVASQPPAEELNPTTLEVVLDYQPERTGTLTLAVRAYSNTIVGQPAQRTVTVLPDLDPGDGGAANTMTVLPPTATPYNPACRARTNTNLNFRRGPSTRYDIILTFSAGQEVPIVGYADGPEGDGRWWQVQYSGQVGWIFAGYTRQLGNCSAIRPASYPALPTPTPTATSRPGETATPSPPDLRLSRLDGATAIVLDARGQAQATYLIEVINQGGTTSSQFRTAVLTPTGEVRHFDVPGLAPGQTFQLAGGGLSVSFNSPGATRILVTVDDTNRVNESNEANNQAYRNIDVQYGPATYTPVAQPTDPPPSTNTPQPTDVPPPTNTSQPTVTPQPTATLDQGRDDDGDQDGVVPLSPITAANASAVAELSTLSGHGGNITALAFNPAGSIVASASRDGTVRLWDSYTDTELAILPHDDRVMDVAFNVTGTTIATVTLGGTIRLWDAASGTEVGRMAHGAEARAVAFSPDGGRVASGGQNPEAAGGLVGLARVWDVASRSEVAAFETFGPIIGVGFTDNNTLVAGSEGQSCELGGGGVEVFDIGSGSSRGIFGDTEWVNALTVSSSTGQIAASGQTATCSGAGVVWVWNAGGTLQATLDHGDSTAITGLAFNPSTAVFAATSSDGLIRLWDLGTRAQIGVLSGHGSALSVAFRPDGTLLATGGTDSMIRLWGVQ